MAYEAAHGVITEGGVRWGGAAGTRLRRGRQVSPGQAVEASARRRMHFLLDAGAFAALAQGADIHIGLMPV
jgi:hypothetical protein